MSLIVSDSLKGLIDENSLNENTSSSLILLVNDINNFTLKNIEFGNKLLTVEVFGDILDISNFIEYRDAKVDLKLLASNKKIDIARGKLIINNISFKKEDNCYTIKSTISLDKGLGDD